MDRFWKNKIFFIPGCSGIFIPYTLTLFLMNYTSIAAGHGSLSEDEQFLHSWVFWNLQPKYVKPKFVWEISQLHSGMDRCWKNNFITLGTFWNHQPNYVELNFQWEVRQLHPEDTYWFRRKHSSYLQGVLESSNPISNVEYVYWTWAWIS